MLFGGALSPETVTALGLSTRPQAAPKPTPAATAPAGPKPSDGALQIPRHPAARFAPGRLPDGRHQRRTPTTRWARPCANCTISAAMRWRATSRSQPVIDGVEGTFTKAPSQRSRRGEVHRQRSGQAAAGRHAAPQRLARGQDRSARAERPSRTPPSSPRRKSKLSKKPQTAIRHRNRPGHHQLRAGLRRNPAGCRPVRTGQRAAAGRFRSW